MSVYSIELLKRNDDGSLGDSIGEYFFLIGLTTINNKYSYKIVIEDTLSKNKNNISVSDMGLGIERITISGEIYTKFKGSPPKKPEGFSLTNYLLEKTGVQNVIDAFDKLIGSVIEKRAGITEYLNLLAFFDVFFRGGKFLSSDSQMIPIANHFFFEKLSNETFNFSEYALVFHDYFKNRDLEVVIDKDGFEVNQNVNDPFSITFTINFIVLRDIKDLHIQKVKSIIERILTINPIQVINNVQNLIDSVVRIPAEISNFSISVVDTIQSFSNIWNNTKETLIGVKNKIQDDGKYITRSWQTSIKNFKKIFNLPEKKNLYENIINSINKATNDLTTIENKFLEEKQKLSNEERKIQDLVSGLKLLKDLSKRILYDIGQSAVVPTSSLEEEAIQGNKNFIDYFRDPIYEAFLYAYDGIINTYAMVIYIITNNNYEIIDKNKKDLNQIAQDNYGDGNLKDFILYVNKNNKDTTFVKVPKLNIRTNNVIYKEPPVITIKDLEKSLLGEDIKLTEDRDFAVSLNGDLAIEEGMNALIQNTIDMLETEEGSLPFYPDYGIKKNLGELPEYYIKISFVNMVINKLLSDPRIIYANIVNERQEGNVIIFTIQITTLTKESFFIDI